jgi:putative transposase
MAGFKSACTKRINDLQNTHGLRVWQRNYYERIIRNDDELNAVRTYIENNPKNWHDDEENQ